MVTLPLFAWILIALTASAALLGFLTSLANEVDHETSVHQLRSQVINLRSKYLRRMIEVYNLEDPVEFIESDANDNYEFVDEQPDSSTPDAASSRTAAA
jgi:hypothetical protein